MLLRLFHDVPEEGVVASVLISGTSTASVLATGSTVDRAQRVRHHSRPFPLARPRGPRRGTGTLSSDLIEGY